MSSGKLRRRSVSRDCVLSLQLSDERREAITRMTFAQLRAALRSGDVRASEALHAFQAAALRAHENTNCLVEPIWEAEVDRRVCVSVCVRVGPVCKKLWLSLFGSGSR